MDLNHFGHVATRNVGRQEERGFIYGIGNDPSP